MIGSSPAETQLAFRRLLETRAAERPQIVVLDDIQWAEDVFLDLVEHVADWSRDAPIFLLCVARPELLELRPGWGGGKLNATTILLEPLSADDCELLLGELAGDLALDAEVRQRILAAADGNPLFLEEMVAMVAEDGGGGDRRPADDPGAPAGPPRPARGGRARRDRVAARSKGRCSTAAWCRSSRRTRAASGVPAHLLDARAQGRDPARPGHVRPTTTPSASGTC